MVVVSSRKDDYLFIRWSHEVKRLGRFCCDICGKRGELNAHHLNGWNWAVEERYDVVNGVPLCGGKEGCHEKFHEIYGKGNNTKEQFEEFKLVMESMFKIAKTEKFIENSCKKLIEKVKQDEAILDLLERLEEDV